MHHILLKGHCHVGELLTLEKIKSVNTFKSKVVVEDCPQVPNVLNKS